MGAPRHATPTCVHRAPSRPNRDNANSSQDEPPREGVNNPRPESGASIGLNSFLYTTLSPRSWRCQALWWFTGFHQ